MTRMKSIGAAFAAVLLSSVAAHAGDVRIMWYSDGGEGAVIKDLLSRFSKANPDVNVILDEVSYDVVKEQLPVQLEAGKGPDIARVTNLKAQAQHWLDLRPLLADAKYWDDNFGAQADWMRPDGSNAITGFMTQLTLTGGFVNKTLFEQAGVEIPGPKATWDDWAAAAKKVADSQKVFAMAIDRSGHRVSGPNISYGANYIGSDGKPAPIDQGAKEPQPLGQVERGGHRQQGCLGECGRHHLSRRGRGLHQWRPCLLLLRQLADFGLRPEDRRQFRLGDGGKPVRHGRLHRHARRRRSGRRQIHPEPEGRRQGDGLPGKCRGAEGICRAQPVHSGA
ncbi:UNVERIFIED_ORG: hypothetical protein GGE53_001092 [Rhizobium etli]